MELLVERNHLLSDYCSDLGLFLSGLSLLSLLKSTSNSVVLSNFVGIHARSRRLDWTRPVEIEVTHDIGQLLNVLAAQFGLIHRHEEVSRQYAPLGSS